MQRLKEDIKNRAFHQLYLLYGEEDYLKKMYKNSLKQAVLEGSDDINYSYFEGKDTDVLQIKETVETLPFFNDYRLVIVEDSGFFKSANTLADYLEDMPESSIVVFVEKETDKRNKLYKYVNKNGLAVEMKQMGVNDIKRFAALMLKENGKKMRESTASPAMDETIALTENRFPPEATFILLMMKAFIVEPERNASSDARVTRGARANT